MGRREEKKRLKRETLMTEGLRLFLEHGFERTSIEQIAAASDVARGTFYNYFDDKLTLFEALIDRWFGLVLELLEHTGERIHASDTAAESLTAYEEMGRGLALIALTHQDELLVTFRENRQPGEAGEALRRRELQLLEVVEAFTVEANERGFIKVANPKVVVLVIFGAVERLYYEFMMGTDFGPAEEISVDVVRMFARTMDLPVGDP